VVCYIIPHTLLSAYSLIITGVCVVIVKLLSNSYLHTACRTSHMPNAKRVKSKQSRRILL